MPSRRDTVPVAGDLLDAVLDASASLIVVVGANGRVVRWNRQCERSSGYEATDFADPRALWKLIPDDEHERATEMMQRLLAGESPLTGEFHWCAKNGSVRLIRWTATGLTGADDKVSHVVANGVDVTEEQREAAERAAAEERLSLAFDHAPIGMALTDTSGRFVRVNPVLSEMTGFTEEELLARSFAEITHPDDATTTRLERRFIRADGRELWVELHRSTVFDPDGTPLGFLGQILDVTSRRQLEDRLRHLADHDSLTGLYNRRRFEEELERHMAHGRRYGQEGALLILDLDGFKAVNDRYGHRAGDRVLASVAGVLRNRLRETDIIARFGGDEFAVLLPHAGRADAGNVAETLATAIATEVTVPGGELTASVGFSVFDESTLSPDDVLSAADDAMYEEKGPGARPEAGPDGPPPE